MKNKLRIKRILAILLCSVSVVLQASAEAIAAGSPAPTVPETDRSKENVLFIKTIADFQEFQKNCMEDRYSIGLTVRLETDLDFRGISFCPVPIFCGTFQGNGHTLCGIVIEGSEAPAGVFRIVEAGGIVDGVTVQASVIPSGDKKEAGGIAGINRGTIRNCTFQGTAEALETLGGIAGINEEGGIIEHCLNDAALDGKRKIGGIAGENSGSIRFCTNRGKINVLGKEIDEEEDRDTLPSFAFPTMDDGREIAMGRSLGGDKDEEEIDLDAEKVRDVGGVAGLSSGVIESCSNEGEVGYPRIGYNMGGIAGRQSGQLLNCSNHSTVIGRKDVGGITGQLDPFLTVEYEDSALDKVSDIMDQLDDTMDSMSDTLDSTGDDVTDRLDEVHAIVEEIRDLTRDRSLEQRRDREDFDEKASRQLDLIDELMDDLELDLGEDDVDDSARSLRKNVREARELLEQLKESGSEITDGDIPLESILENLENIAAGLNDCAENIADDADSLVDDAYYGIQDGMEDFGDQLDSIKTAAGDLKDIVEDYKDTLFDAMDESGDDISAQMDRISRELDRLSDDLEADRDRLDTDKDRIESHLDDINDAIDEGHSRLIDEIDDLTDEDTPLFKDISAENERLGSGTVVSCQNLGPIQADFQGGGIVGTIGLESALDPDDDIEFLGETSIRMNRYVSAYVLNSKNKGSVTVQNDDAGGIGGVAWFGILKGNEKYGDIETTDGDYCGGIAGESQAVIQNNYNKSIMTGNSFLGGIAGKGKTVTENYSMAQLFFDDGRYIGNLAGDLYEDAAVYGNHNVKNGYGAVNNITFRSQAAGTSYEEFMALQDMPEEFKKMTVTFLADDEIVEQIVCGYGESITWDQIPAVPEKTDHFGTWGTDGLSNIIWDCRVEANYQPWLYAVSSSDDPKPELIAEGTFMPGASVTFTQAGFPGAAGVLPFGDQLAGCYSYIVSDPYNETPANTAILHVLAGSADAVGLITEHEILQIPVEKDQEYLIFSADTSGSIVLLKKRSILPFVLAAAVMGGIALGVIGFRKKRSGSWTKARQDDTGKKVWHQKIGLRRRIQSEWKTVIHNGNIFDGGILQRILCRSMGTTERLMVL